MTDQVSYEVVAVMNDALLVRFSLGGKHRDSLIQWDGSGTVDDLLKSYAMATVRALQAPPPPTREVLQQYVGLRGLADITPFMPPVPPPVPPPMSDPPPMPPMGFPVTGSG